ncbi:diacylglycerol glucosyltransferase [Bacillus methanolicus]|uniref:MGDG synthase family glycosyltransferase n=1 Tax=Bacillus methanolicus TaxID=1471 RepID=UPI00238001E2|nr:glycosyltransferase [Bacillus methanolicus]MDE3839302.1 diacylglycerol glucosyltransferase [Bacillus methanolicus]
MKRPSALILTARYGSGHLQAAKVLAQELNRKGFESVVSDLFGESYPAFTNLTQTLLLKSFTYGPSFYKWFYYGTNKLHSKGLVQFSKYLGRKRLLELIALYNPAFVITTFPLHTAPFFIKKSKSSIPVYTVITDYCAHPYWTNPLIDHYFVASKSVKLSLLAKNIEEQRITVSGIPIRSSFEMDFNRKMVYRKYKISSHKKVITILAGADGVLKNVKELCETLLQNPAYQVLVVCGRNEKLYEKLSPLVLRFPDSIRLFQYVEEIHEIFIVSDCLVTKPGGLTLTESAALQIPLILYKPVPGQEAENAKYFAEKGAALISYSNKETFDHIQRLFQDETLATKMKNSLNEIYQPFSAKTIADFAIKQIEENYVITL